MPHSFLKTAQFAKICLTTKDTLIHYDRIGVLKPRRVLENGYRLYAAEQFYDFEFLGLLTASGLSLSEIRTYFSAHREPDHRALFEKCREGLAARRRLIERQIDVIDHLMEAHEAMSALVENEVVIEEIPRPRTYRLFPIEPVDFFDAEAAVARASAVMRRQLDREGSPCEPPCAIRIGLSEAEAGELEFNAYLIRPMQGEALKPEDAITLEPGRYASLLVKSALPAHGKAAAKLLSEVRRLGLELSGDVFVFDQLNYLEYFEGRYAALWTVRVREKRAADV